MTYPSNYKKLSILAIFFAVTGLTLHANPPATTGASTQASRGIILLGRVCDNDGSSPISNAIVAVFETRKGGTRTVRGSLCAIRTNSVGAFAFDQYIPQGSYEIRVIRNGEVIVSQSLAITKEAKSITVLQIQTYGGVLEGTIFKASGKPAIGVTIVLVGTVNSRVFEAETDKKGHYIVDHIAFGSYKMAAVLRDIDGMQQAIVHVGIDSDHAKKDVNLE